MKVLTISAHIIDGLIGCGGITLQLIERGNQVKAVFTSDMKRESIPMVMKELGVEDFDTLDLPINSQEERYDELREKLAKIVSRENPDVIMTLWPSEHVLSDHCMTGRATQEAFVKQFGIDSDRRLYFFEVTQYVPDFRADVYVEIAEEQWQKKVECITMLEAFTHRERDLMLDEMELRALQHGAECSAASRYAEALARFRPLIIPVSSL